MRARLVSRVALGVVCVFALPSASARAGIVASDTISYPDGPLAGQNGGSGWSGAWSGFATSVVGGEAVGTSSVEFQAVRSFPYPGTTPEMFVSIVIRTPAFLDAGEFIGIFLLAGANGSALALGKTLGNDHFAVGNSGFVYSNIPVQTNTTYHLIGVADSDQGRVALWVNPDAADFYEPATGANSADVTTIINTGAMDRISIWGTEAGTAFDDLVLGDTPESVGLRSGGATAVGELPPGPENSAGWTASSPNPCHGVAHIRFRLPTAGPATLSVFDVQGRMVEATPLGFRPNTTSDYVWSARGVPAGVYFYEIRGARGLSVQGKLTVAR